MNMIKRIKEEMSDFPEGSKNHNFFKLLLKKFEPDFLRESVRKELNESHASLSGSIQQYFKHHVIYSSMLKAVENTQMQQNEYTQDSLELFYLNILKKYVHSDKPCEKLKFFEESGTLLRKMLENKQKSQAVKTFSKSVEDNIDEFCIQFSELILQKNVDMRNWDKHFDKAVKQLSQRIATLDSESQSLSAITPELQEILSIYYQEITEGIRILDNLIELYRQKLDSQLLQSKVAVDRSIHLNMKAEGLELEILVSTYSKKAVEALQLIKKELDSKKEETDKNLVELKDRLEEYQILGPEYQLLVDKYQLLTENIEKQKLVIEHLKADIEETKK